ncbi:MAG: uroporphyrinogen-III C-methyltransferase [Inquilinus sp.]|nr:uroporphyrinogen-III C-methyltransferase [Inquilinus sp.]
MREQTRYPVAIVGAGPGDPELLTVKALRLLGDADAVVYDRLVSAEVRALIPAGAMQVFVGKASNCHPTPQDEINDLIVRLARGGRRVVRLKGGDPFVFGRGSEEAEHLALHGVAFEVVPGITAASGCASAAGIPLTHRGLATGVRFVTGHRSHDGDLDLNWSSLADPETTLVVYMGLANLPTIRDRLIEAGLPAETPAAAIACGTTPDERICGGMLADLPELALAEGLKAPVLLVIGRVVALAETWGSVGRLPADVVRIRELVAEHG